MGEETKTAVGIVLMLAAFSGLLLGGFQGGWIASLFGPWDLLGFLVGAIVGSVATPLLLALCALVAVRVWVAVGGAMLWGTEVRDG